MPKEGLTSREWAERLEKFAAGGFEFGRGQRPPKGSNRAMLVETIGKCPIHRNTSLFNPFGKRIVCVCGYHRDPSHPATAFLQQPVTAVFPSSQPVAAVSAPQLISPLPQQVAAISAPQLIPPLPQPVAAISAPQLIPPLPQPVAAVSAPQLIPPLPQPVTATYPSPQQSPQPVMAVSPSQPVSAGSAPQQVSPLPQSVTATYPATAPQPVSIQQLVSLTPALASQQVPSSSSSYSYSMLQGQVNQDISFLPPPLPRHATDFSLRLPKGWRESISQGDQGWIGRALFVSKGKLATNLKLWWHPPDYKLPTGQPSPDAYHHQRLFLWMPRRMWRVEFTCPTCPTPQYLRSKGVYNHVRQVMDSQDMYYLAGEYMDCNSCHRTYISWDSRILVQLADGVRAHFSIVLTRKYACNVSVISLLRGRTLGNSPSAFYHNLAEVHSEEWLRRQLCYLQDCHRHRDSCMRFNQPIPVYGDARPFQHFPTPTWFLSVYVRDVWSRLPALLAAATSTYGSILKIDSTKKVCKKLQGHSANTASWATNVGNEKGEVLMSVLTESEGSVALHRMVVGLMDRYNQAGISPPLLLYTDRDCCSISGPSKYKALFSEWKDLLVRLDIWHFMRRLARGCTSESHPLYGTFMAQISSCIFEWDDEDVDLLMSAKRGELVLAGVPNVSTSAVTKAMSRKELSKHCKRKTRGTEETVKLIEELLLSLSTATDTLGVPLFREEMKEIWEEQQHHIACIQDPPNIPLYTITGHINKGGVRLPILRCGRGSTSLESFHLHIARFIPGTSANAVHYQAYLLEGVTRWNSSRAAAALDAPTENLRTFDTRLQQKVNDLSVTILGKKVFPHYRPLPKYTGELFGVEYLFAQTGMTFKPDVDIEQEIDEGFGDSDQELIGGFDLDLADAEDATVAVPMDDSASEDETNQATEEDEEESGDSVDSRGIPGWDRVDKLAAALLALRGLCVTNAQAAEIQVLYRNLLEYDKKPLTYPPRSLKPPQGRFARSKSKSHIGVDHMKKCFLSAGNPAMSPSKSRVVEALCLLLTEKHTVPKRVRRVGQRQVFTSRWRIVLNEYNSIRSRLVNSQSLLEGTNLVLYPINETTLVRWFKDVTRTSEIKMLLQGLPLPSPSMVSTSPLPPPKTRPSSPPLPPIQQHTFEEPVDTVGQARLKSLSTSTAAAATHNAAAAAAKANTTCTVSATAAATVTTIAAATSLPCSAQTSLQPPLSSPPVVSDSSRTTLWRRRKAESSISDQHTATKKARIAQRGYCCKTCGQPSNKETGHTQFRGKRYCPNDDTCTKQKW